MPTNRDTLSLPILPWTGVLFPGMRLTLTIDGPLGQAMIAEASLRDTGVVVCLARSAPETGAAWPEPLSIGTVARVLDYPQHTSPQSVVVVGISRVSLLSFRLVHETLVGQFRFMPDSEDTIPNPLVDEAQALGSEMWSIMRSESTRPLLPQTPEALSYWIAAHIPVPTATRQELLEIRSTRGRLAKEITLLRTMMDGLRTEHSS